ncbi:hypothetical protein QOT17_018278 [Balamuthia mandrillaris]
MSTPPPPPKDRKTGLIAADQALLLKCYFGPNIKMVQVEDALSLAQLLHRLEGLFGRHLEVYFKDSEGDQLPLQKEEDYRDVVARYKAEQWPNVKLCLYQTSTSVERELIKVVLKVHFEEQVRLSEVDVGTLNNLRSVLEQTCGSFKNLRYKDEEGELISIQKQQDLDAALKRYGSQGWRLLELHLQPLI